VLQYLRHPAVAVVAPAPLPAATQDNTDVPELRWDAAEPAPWRRATSVPGATSAVSAAALRLRHAFASVLSGTAAMDMEVRSEAEV
jgi:hypothetical protein